MRSVVTSVLFAALAATPRIALTLEGGTSHVLPGATATLLDVPATTPTWFVKPMYLYYHGTVSARIPTAAGLAGHVDAQANTVAVAAGRTFERTVFGGAHYTAAVALPFSWLDVSADVQAFGRRVARHSLVSGLGDLTVIPTMLAWKIDDWQIDATLPVYAPTGNYEKGRLGNPGLNYWTVDPTVGMVYADEDSGFNAMAHVGYGINTENPATDYRSGSQVHLEAALQQIVPMGPAFLTLGVEGFFFQQVTGDSGDGATLGAFKGRTAGVGPALGLIQPFGARALLVEAKWLPELGTKRRLHGDYVWAKMVFKF